MLADEDTTAFDYGYNPYYGVQRHGSGSTSSSGRRRERMTFGEVLQGSWASLRFATEAMFIMQWARLSDRVGRKPVLLTGVGGLSISMLCFGLSKTFTGLVIR